jgi:orotidine-5'-phosphate decarboxylase
VVPGIRLEGGPSADQQRTFGPRAAVEAGADLIVVGRPITEASDPRAAARSILEQVTA